MQPLPVIVIEALGLGITGYGLWRMILDKWQDPITPDLIENGRRNSLDLFYRWKMERGVCDRVRRGMLAVERAAKRWSAKRIP